MSRGADVVFEKVYEAVAASPGEARDAVCRLAERAQFAPARIADIRLAVSEAVANAARHAYDTDAGGPVTVSASVRQGTLTVRVCDRGRGLGGVGASGGLGAGLRLIARLADSISISTSAESGTQLEMQFSRGGAGERTPANGR